MTAADWQPLRDLAFDDQGLLEVAHLISISTISRGWPTVSA